MTVTRYVNSIRFDITADDSRPGLYAVDGEVVRENVFNNILALATSCELGEISQYAAALYSRGS